MVKKKKSNSISSFEERTRFQYIDIIISSGKIKKLFFERCLELELNPYSVAMTAKISMNAFKKHYVNNPCPSATHTMPQEKFLNMLEMVGIDIRVLIKVQPIEKAKEIAKNHKIYKSSYDE
jgi:hypothetical protein